MRDECISRKPEESQGMKPLILKIDRESDVESNSCQRLYNV